MSWHYRMAVAPELQLTDSAPSEGRNCRQWVYTWSECRGAARSEMPQWVTLARAPELRRESLLRRLRRWWWKLRAQL